MKQGKRQRKKPSSASMKLLPKLSGGRSKKRGRKSTWQSKKLRKSSKRESKRRSKQGQRQTELSPKPSGGRIFEHRRKSLRLNARLNLYLETPKTRLRPRRQPQSRRQAEFWPKPNKNCMKPSARLRIPSGMLKKKRGKSSPLPKEKQARLRMKRVKTPRQQTSKPMR